MNNKISLLFYFFVFFVLFLFSLPSYKNEKRKAIIVCVLSVVLLTLVGGLRGLDVGADTPQYVSVYSDFATSSFPFSNIRFEKGFTRFRFLCYKISSNPSLLLFRSALFRNLCTAIFVYKSCKNVPQSILLYCLCAYLGNLSGRRQGRSVALLLLFIPALYKKKYWLYLLGVLLSGLFHKVGLIGLLLVFAPRIKPSKKFNFIRILLSVMLTFAGKPLLIFFISKTPFYYYIDTEFFNAAPLGGVYNRTLPFLGFFLLSPALEKKSVTVRYVMDSDSLLLLNYYDNVHSSHYVPIDREGNAGKIYLCLPNASFSEIAENKQKVRNLSRLLSICFSIVSINFSIFSRIYSVFLLPFVLLISDYLMEGDLDNKKQKEFLFVLCAALLLAVQGIFRPNWIGVFNYHFVF